MDPNINTLPAEMIVHISKYLNVQDKLKLRSINKSFKTVFDNFIKFDCLTIISNRDFFNRNWFYTNRSNKEIETIEFKSNVTKTILNNLFMSNVFMNVRKLFFYLVRSINFDDTINQFKNLEELNLFCAIKSNSTISLSKLRILSINTDSNYFTAIKIELDTPLLSILRCENLDYYLFKYPEKLIYFDTAYIFNTFRAIQAIQIFKNLQSVLLEDDKLKEFKNVLTKLNNLKEIHVYTYSAVWNYVELSEFKELYEYKMELKLNDLKMFLSGIDYENIKESNENLSKPINQFELILRNFSKTVDIIPFIDKIDFNKLYEFLNCNLDVSLDMIIRKFPNIKNIVANLTKENVDCFFEFLSKCDNLIILNLELLLDNQIIYLNRLSNSFRTVEYLSIKNFHINESTNLDFLYKFDYLKQLTFDKIEDLNILINLRNNLLINFECNFLYRNRLFPIGFFGKSYHYKNGIFSSENELTQYLDNSIDKK